MSNATEKLNKIVESIENINFILYYPRKTKQHFKSSYS